MSVKLIDLQLIYGVAGAREHFEDLAAHLVESEYPGATKVRIKQGDGGIDIRVGDITNPAGIHVFQCKFFPQGIEDTQKAQIRNSFNACRDSTEFKTRRWTLCLPLDLSLGEATWFEEWKRKQNATGIFIDEVWGATKLEGLLYHDKNKGVKEYYFKEEYLTQIREIHALLHRLIPDIIARLQQDLSTSEAVRKASQGEYIDQFISSAKAEVQALKDQASAPVERIGFWEIAIYPALLPSHMQINTLNECKTIVKECHIRGGWPFPELSYGSQQVGIDWVGLTCPMNGDFLIWRFSQRGVFVYLHPMLEDLSKAPPNASHLLLPCASGLVPNKYFSIDMAIRNLTHIFQFAASLVEKAYVSLSCAVNVRIALTETRDRILTQSNMHFVSECCCATEYRLENSWECSQEDLKSGANDLAIKAAAWFFERFNSSTFNLETLKQLQQSLSP